MKIIIQVVQHLNAGGIETMALDLHHYHLSQGNKSYIVSLEGKKETCLAQWPRLNNDRHYLIFLNKPNKLSLTLVVTLSKLINSLNADVIHSHHIGPLLYSGLALIAKKHIIHIHTEHDAWHLKNKKRRLLQKFILKISKPKLVADAQTVASSLQKYIKLDNVTVINNGINTHVFNIGNKTKAREYFKLPQDKILVGCSGRLEVVKGQKTLVQSLCHLPKHYHLAFAGAGSQLANLQQLVKTLHLTSRVHFLGRIDDMPYFYQSLSVFCLPSFNEGMPLAPLEAQSSGIQSIVTNVGGAKESLCPKTGLLIAPGKPKEMAEAIKKQSHKQQHSPRAFVTEKADILRMASSYAKLFS